MLPTTIEETLKDASKRHTNFLTLSHLENNLDSTNFQKVLENTRNIDLPLRLDWTGKTHKLTFEEVKQNNYSINSDYLQNVVQNHQNQEISQNQNLKGAPKTDAVFQSSDKLMLGMFENVMMSRKMLERKNVSINHKEKLRHHQITKFERRKTVFGHAIMEEGVLAPVFNVQFDKLGKLIFSGADDGIIKVWDRDSLTLQASLHSHTDFISDIDVSKCNKYLASCSKDMKVIIWDIEKCKKVDEISDHQSEVKNVKFFEFKNKLDPREKPFQILVTCSADGSVNIYDELTYLSQQSEDKYEGNRKSLRKTEVQQKRNRFAINLKPQDNRPGTAKNKQIDAVNVNSNGVIVAGTDKGDIILWKIDIKAFQRGQTRVTLLCKLQFQEDIGSSKKHQKNVHLCEFSPNGKYLLTGSIDGTANVWDVDIKKKDTEFELTDDKLKFQFSKPRKDSQCDSINWSVNGRYAIVSISGKKNQDANSEIIVQLKVWDSFTGEQIKDLSRMNEVVLQTSCFVIICHPVMEEIFVSGSEGGMICIWNIKTLSLIKKFTEYGVYSIDKFTMSDPLDGKFSPDGNAFVIGSNLGTISLFSCNNDKSLYAATRVEQFFQYDDKNHTTDIYDTLKEAPKICNYNLIPHEYQPSTVVGKFKEVKKNMSQEDRIKASQEFEKNYQFRVYMCEQEEEIIQGQLQEGIRNEFYQNDEGREILNQGFMDIEQDDNEVALNRANQNRNRINSNPSQISQRNQMNRISDDDVEMIDASNQRRPRRQNSAYDRQSDENFQVNESDDNEDSFESDFVDESEQPEYKPHTGNASRRTRYYDNEEQKYQQISSRQERFLRRQNEEAKKEEAKRSKKRRCVIQSGETSHIDQSDDQDYQMSDEEMIPKKAKRTLDSNSDDSGEASNKRFTRRQAANSKKRDASHNRNESKRRLRKGERVRYDGMDGSEDEDVQMIQPQKRSNEEEKRPPPNRRRRQIGDDSDEEDQIITTSKAAPNKRRKYDEDFELIENVFGRVSLEEEMIDVSHQQKCAFCQRIDTPLVGPFRNTKRPNQGLLYFHSNCLEINDYSFYEPEKNKWVNIGKALDQLQGNNSLMCLRCFLKGATVKCQACDKRYHGFLCANFNMVCVGDNQYVCLTCKNSQNNEELDGQKIIMSKELELTRISLPRDHLIQFKNMPNSPYQPQIGDEVYYMFQGHEDLMSIFNCQFFCGDTNNIANLYSWITHSDLLEATLCKVVEVSYQFPSEKAIHLLHTYGKDSDPKQYPQILTKVTLEFKSGSARKQFEVTLFPNHLPDFLIQKQKFEYAQERKMQAEFNNSLIGKEFKCKRKGFNKVKVIETRGKEPSLFPNSLWQTLVCTHQEQYNLRERGRRGRSNNQNQNQETFNLSMWEIDFGNEEDLETKAFSDFEVEQILKIITDQGCKRPEQATFSIRVTEQIAPDYKAVIAAEMFLNLIQDRLKNGYYRQQQQFFYDLQLIATNSSTYNGDKHELTKLAEKIVDGIKSEVKKTLNKKQIIVEQQNELQQKPIGKLTAPSRIDNSYQSSFDAFMKQQDKPTQPSAILAQTLIEIPANSLNQPKFIEKYEEQKIAPQSNKIAINKNGTLSKERMDKEISMPITPPTANQRLDEGHENKRQTRGSLKLLETADTNKMSLPSNGNTGEKLSLSREVEFNVLNQMANTNQVGGTRRRALRNNNNKKYTTEYSDNDFDFEEEEKHNNSKRRKYN